MLPNKKISPNFNSASSGSGRPRLASGATWLWVLFVGVGVCVEREVFECRVTASYCQCVKLSRVPRRLLLTDPKF